MFVFFFWNPAEYLPIPKTLELEHRVKVLCRHQLNCSMVNELCGCCPQQWDFAVCGENLEKDSILKNVKYKSDTDELIKGNRWKGSSYFKMT